MNQCTFIGNLGKDVEVRQAGQTPVANVSLAVTKRSKGENTTVWVPLTMWGKTAELAQQYLRKGSKIAVTCSFELNDWADKDGNKRQSPVFHVNNMEFVDSKPQGQQQGGQQQNAQPQQNYQTPLAQNQADYLEDSIPF